MAAPLPKGRILRGGLMRIAITIDGKVEWYKDIEITTQSEPIPKPIPIPIPPIPIPLPEPVGERGSKTNPYKINIPTSKIGNGYVPEFCKDDSRGPIQIAAGKKIYFEVEPLAITGRSVAGFGVSIKFYSGMGTVCQLTQDKATLAHSPEDCRGHTSFMSIVYNNQPYKIDNTRFLYAIDNSEGEGNASDEIWATIP